MDVEWNLHSREGALAASWPELADPNQNQPQATAHQARVAINSEVQGVAA